MIQATIVWFRDHSALAMLLTLASLGVFLVGAVAVRWLLVWMPADYFCRHGGPATLFGARHPAVRWTLLVLKNLLGLALLTLGILMLVAPGPGTLGLLAGLSLMNFPGKRALELAIVRNRVVLRAINAIRARSGRPALVLPEPRAA